jgi:hypothetical protein
MKKLEKSNQNIKQIMSSILMRIMKLFELMDSYNYGRANTFA